MQRSDYHDRAAIAQAHQQARRLLLTPVRYYCGRHIGQNPQDSHHAAATSVKEPDDSSDGCGDRAITELMQPGAFVARCVATLGGEGASTGSQGKCRALRITSAGQASIYEYKASATLRKDALQQAWLPKAPCRHCCARRETETVTPSPNDLPVTKKSMPMKMLLLRPK